jgi:hypothetical protein
VTGHLTGAAALRPGARARSIADLPFAPLGAAALFVLLAATTWGAWGDVGRDTGYDLVAAGRLAHGALPYVDFPYAYGPLGVAALAAAEAIGGAGVTVAALTGMVVAAAIVAATFLLGRRLVGETAAAVVAAGVCGVAFAPTNYDYALPHSVSAPAALLATLVVLLLVGRSADRGGAAALLATGFAAGAVALTRLEFELAVLVALALWLALRGRAGQSVRREALLVGLPALGVPAAVYGAALVRVPFHTLVFHDLYPLAFMRAGGAANLRTSAPLDLRSVLDLAAVTALYAAGAAALALLGRRGGDRVRRIVAPIAAGAAIVAIVAVVADPERARYGLKLAYAGIPAGAAIALVVLTVRAWRARRISPDAQVMLAGLAALTVLAAKSYAAFYLYSDTPQVAAYLAPLALLFLACVHLRGRVPGQRAVGLVWLVFLVAAGAALTVHDARADRATIRGDGGSLRVPAAEAAMDQAAIRWIEATTPAGGPVLLAPQLTALYAVSDRADALPQISLLPGALEDVRAQRRAIATLRASSLRLVVTDRRPLTAYDQGAWGRSYDTVLAGWVRRHFIHAATLRPSGPSPHVLDVWLRRDS